MSDETPDPFEHGLPPDQPHLNADQQARANNLALTSIRHRLTDQKLPHLDRLALTRAAVWIAHSDGYGAGVTYKECKTLQDPRAAAMLPATARTIILRLSQVVTTPDADGLAVAGSDALAGILPDDPQ